PLGSVPDARQGTGLGAGLRRLRGPTSLVPLPEHEEERRRDEDRRVGAGDETDEEDERESADRLATEDEKRGDRQERRHRREERTAERLVDAQVDALTEGEVALLSSPPPVLADAVEDDDGVVDRIADRREKSGHLRQVELDRDRAAEEALRDHIHDRH